MVFVTVGVFLAVVQCFVQAQEDINPVIAYKYVNEYQHVWDNSDSSADFKVSIWRPVEIENRFYPLGDVVTPYNHFKPNTHALTVRAIKRDALAEPVGFTQVWNNTGSHAGYDVRIFRMNSPFGYSCLGHVAVKGFNQNFPNKANYRCVKLEYTTLGKFDYIWSNTGRRGRSESRYSVSFWENTNIESDTGIASFTFTAFDTFDRPTIEPQILNSLFAIKQSTLILSEEETDTVALVVYQFPLNRNTDQIWNNTDSNAQWDISIWKPQQPSLFFSLGDRGVPSYEEPRFGILVQSLKEGVLRAPVSYRQRWSNHGSRADLEVAIYEPVCPPGYRVLGYISMRSHSTPPSINATRCVHSNYTVRGVWVQIWNNTKRSRSNQPEANLPVSIYKAVATSEDGQALEALSAFPLYHETDRIPYVLNAAYTSYIVRKPIRRFVLKDLQYNVDNFQLVQQQPDVLARTVIFNRGNTTQTVSRSIGYSYSETHSWSFMSMFSFQIQISVQVQVFIVTLGFSFTHTSTFSHMMGGSATETTSDTVNVAVAVQPRSQKVVSITSTKSEMDVPYTATVIPQYFDGTKGTPYTYSGIYHGVRVNDIKVVYEDDVPIFDADKEDRQTRGTNGGHGSNGVPGAVKSSLNSGDIKITQSVFLIVCVLALRKLLSL